MTEKLKNTMRKMRVIKAFGGNSEDTIMAPHVVHKEKHEVNIKKALNSNIQDTVRTSFLFQNFRGEKGDPEDIEKWLQTQNVERKEMSAVLQNDPAFQFRSTKEIQMSKKDGIQGAYFNEVPQDSIEFAQKAVEKSNKIKEEKKALESGEPKVFFDNIYEQVDLAKCYSNGEHKDEKCIHPESEINRDVLQMFLAVHEVSRETIKGEILERFRKGLITDFSMHQLKIAYQIFKGIVEYDLENQLVSIDILKLAKDPSSALVNVVEKMQALDLDQMGGSDEAQKLQEQVKQLMEDCGKDPIDHETMKQISIYLARQRGDSAMSHKLETQHVSEQQLIEYIGKQSADDIADFPERIKDVHQNAKILDYYESDDSDTESKRWNFKDGMTSCINSTEQRADDSFEIQNKKLNLIDIVENIEDISQTAAKMKITRNEYLDSLRQVTKNKIEGIKEAKNIFEKRIRKMNKAQHYELQNQKKIGVGIAQNIFRQKAEEVKTLFNFEVKHFDGEYEVLNKIISMQDKHMKKYSQDLCMQEVIIGNLSNHISVNMLGRFEERIEQREAEATREQAFQYSDPYRLLTKNKAFDFYGKQIRVAQTEEDKYINNRFIKEAHYNLFQKDAEAAQLKIELEQMKDMVESAISETASYKSQLHTVTKQLEESKCYHEEDMAKLERRNKTMVREYQDAIDRGEDTFAAYRDYAGNQLKIKEVIQVKMEEQVQKFKDGSKQMRAILRVPILCKKFHDAIRVHGIEEFQALNDLYSDHFQKGEPIKEIKMEKVKPKQKVLVDRSTQTTKKSKEVKEYAKKEKLPSMRATSTDIGPLYQRFMTQEGKRQRGLFSPPQHAHQQSLGISMNTKPFSKNNIDIQSLRRQAGRNLDGSLNSQPFSINFIKKKYSKIDNLIEKKAGKLQQHKNSIKTFLPPPILSSLPAMDQKRTSQPEVNWLNSSINLTPDDSLDNVGYNGSCTVNLTNDHPNFSTTQTPFKNERLYKPQHKINDRSLQEPTQDQTDTATAENSILDDQYADSSREVFLHTSRDQQSNLPTEHSLKMPAVGRKRILLTSRK